MNYIHQLKAARDANAAQICHLENAIRELRALALSNKHQGVSPDGQRNDWIASSDILRWTDQTLYGETP